MTRASSKRNPRTRALQYRDGLMLAFLALRPIRLANLAMMELGRHVLIDDDTVLVRFASAETKTHRDALAEFRTQLAARHPKLGVVTGLMARSSARAPG